MWGDSEELSRIAEFRQRLLTLEAQTARLNQVVKASWVQLAYASGFKVSGLAALCPREAGEAAPSPGQDGAAASRGQIRWLERLFDQVCGLTPHEWLTSVRMTDAWLLISDGEKLSAVAATLHFRSQGHFTSAFQQWWGYPPSAATQFALPTLPLTFSGQEVAS